MLSLDKLLSDLKREEGWRPFAYKDTEGLTTVGYGFCIDEKRGAPLPVTIGDFWLSFIVDRLVLRLNEELPWLVMQPDDVQRALAQMAYQIGIDGLERFTKMLAALQVGDRQTAAREALDSTWHKQTPARAERVAALIRGSN